MSLCAGKKIKFTANESFQLVFVYLLDTFYKKLILCFTFSWENNEKIFKEFELFYNDDKFVHCKQYALQKRNLKLLIIYVEFLHGNECKFYGH